MDPAADTPATVEDWSFGLPPPSAANARAIAWVGVAAVLAWSLWLRLADLGGSLNLDAVYYWFRWTDAFWTAVADGNWKGTYLASHPGALPMWLAGASMKLQGVLAAEPSPANIAAAKLPLAVMNGLAPAVMYALARKRLGPTGLWPALAFAALWASEPFMVSHARLFYMDVPFATWSAIGMWLCAIGLQQRSPAWIAAAGLAFGFAAATRVLPTLTVLAGVGLWLGVPFVASRGRDVRLVAFGAILCATTLATLAVLWPSFLVAPADTFERLVETATQMLGAGHRTFSWGSVSHDPGAIFYVAVLLAKTSPETLIAAPLGLVVALARPPQRRLCLGLIAASAPYLVAILWSSKRVGRYLIDIHPLLLFFAAIGGVYALGRVAHWTRARVSRRSLIACGLALVAIGAWGRTARLTPFGPHLAAWCQEYPGLACERLIAFRPFIGLRETALWIAARGPGRRPAVFVTHFGPGRKRNVMPWLDYAVAQRPARAEYVVVIDSILARGYENALVTRLVEERAPDFVFRLNDRAFVRVYHRRRLRRAPDAQHGFDPAEPGQPRPPP